RQDGVGTHDLAARRPFRRRQRLALSGEPPSLLGCEADPAPTGCRRESLLEHTNFFVEVLDPSYYPLGGRMGEHRDEELEGEGEHRRPDSLALKTKDPDFAHAAPRGKIMGRWVSGHHAWAPTSITSAAEARVPCEHRLRSPLHRPVVEASHRGQLAVAPA